MLTLPDFAIVHPGTLEEAAQALAGAGGEAQLLAGGTDLLPNLKHGLHAPRRLVSLRRVDSLRAWGEQPDGGVWLGAGLTLAALTAHPVVRARYPALAQAAGLVAGPQIRNMGTLGGNLCLDTRCIYYNQTHFWRRALGYCLKKDGTVCHVVPQGSRCVAAHSADTPGPLLAYGATVVLASVRGTRRVPLRSFYRAEGTRNTVREPDEILTRVELPPPPPGLRAAYQKLRLRGAIDFPLLSVAVAVALDRRERVEQLSLFVGVLGARPRRVARAEETARGRPLDDALRTELGRLAHDQSHPLPALNVDSAWRRDMVAVLVERALTRLR